LPVGMPLAAAADVRTTATPGVGALGRSEHAAIAQTRDSAPRRRRICLVGWFIVVLKLLDVVVEAGAHRTLGKMLSTQT
jgi:hypothetical protein